jgi:hypothetical protein
VLKVADRLEFELLIRPAERQHQRVRAVGGGSAACKATLEESGFFQLCVHLGQHVIAIKFYDVPLIGLAGVDVHDSGATVE